MPLALVTGASRRLGKAFALALARKGHAILLHYNRAGAEAELVAGEIRRIGVPAHPVCADLRDERGLGLLFKELDRIDGTLKVVVNSAAEMPDSHRAEKTMESWDSVLDLNVRAPFFISRRASERMSDGGLIVNVSDVGARKAWSRFPEYTISKAALESATRLLARSLAPSIRVNAIAPGLILQSDVVSEQEWSRLVDRLPLRRPGTVEEVALALTFLLENEYITGQTIVVDGGYALV